MLMHYFLSAMPFKFFFVWKFDFLLMTVITSEIEGANADSCTDTAVRLVPFIEDVNLVTLQLVGVRSLIQTLHEVDTCKIRGCQGLKHKW